MSKNKNNKMKRSQEYSSENKFNSKTCKPSMNSETLGPQVSSPNMPWISVSSLKFCKKKERKEGFNK